MDLPLLTEATNDFYRNVYAHPSLRRIFKGVNMVILRYHVAYFLYQIAASDSGISQEQLDHLRRVHKPIMEQFQLTQYHFDLWMSLLIKAMKSHGAEESLLKLISTRLIPVRDMFPAAVGSAADGIAPSKNQQRDSAPADVGSGHQFKSADVTAAKQQQVTVKAREGFVDVEADSSYKQMDVQKERSSCQACRAARRSSSWLGRIAGCLCGSSVKSSSG